MIISFRHKGLELLYRHGATQGVHSAHVRKLLRILAVLDVATRPADLDIPAFRLHPLKGQLNGFWAIHVNGNWRVICRFAGENVELVDYLDYH